MPYLPHIFFILLHRPCTYGMTVTFGFVVVIGVVDFATVGVLLFGLVC